MLLLTVAPMPSLWALESTVLATDLEAKLEALAAEEAILQTGAAGGRAEDTSDALRLTKLSSRALRMR